MTHINNHYYINAYVSEGADILCNTFPIDIPYFKMGIWYDGTHKYGRWYPKAIWLNGNWIDGEIYSFWNVYKNGISPKSFRKPKTTLSLNYATYK